MLWTDDDPPALSRSRAELLDGIERRGLALRRRRRLARRSVAGSAALAVTIALISVLPSRGSDPSVVVAAPESSTTSTAHPGVDPASAAPTSSVVSPTTVAPASTVVATVPTVPPTTMAGTAPPTTEPPPPEPQCGAAQLVATVTTDKASYRPGETVRYTSVVRNSSSVVCYFAGYESSTAVMGPGDVAVSPVQVAHSDAFAYIAFEPGQSKQVAGDWNQCTGVFPAACSPASPGGYAVSVDWTFSGPAVKSVAPFTLVAADPPVADPASP